MNTKKISISIEEEGGAKKASVTLTPEGEEVKVNMDFAGCDVKNGKLADLFYFTLQQVCESILSQREGVEGAEPCCDDPQNCKTC